MVDTFGTIGAGQWLRYVIGGLELVGAIGLLVPRLCGPAALGLAGLMVGATVTNVSLLGASPVIPIAYLLIAAVIVWFRLASIRTMVQRLVASGTPGSS